MVSSARFAFYKWFPASGGWERLFDTETKSYDIELRSVISGTSNATLGCEESGGNAIASDVPINFGNFPKFIVPEGWDERSGLAAGSIELGYNGIFYPLLGSVGDFIIVAVGVIYAERAANKVAENMPDSVDTSLLTGEINTYKEYIEDVEVIDAITGEASNVDSVNILPCYLEAETAVLNQYSCTAEVIAYALDGLLKYLSAKDLILPLCPTLTDVAMAIKALSPFIENIDATGANIGDIMWLVKLAEYDPRADDPATFAAGTPFLYNRIIQWKLASGDESHYVELTTGASRYIVISPEISPIAFLMPKYIHTAAGTGFYLDPSLCDSPDMHAYQPSQCWPRTDPTTLLPTIGGDLGYTRCPYRIPADTSLSDAESYRVRLNGLAILNQLHGCETYSGLIHWVGIVMRAGEGQWYFFARPWDGSNWEDAALYTDIFGRPALVPTEINVPYDYYSASNTFIWRYGWKRIWILSPDKSLLFSWPAPEHSVLYGNITDEPLIYTHGGGAWNTIRGAIIACVAAHLGQGDKEAAIVSGAGTAYEKFFRLYPIYWHKEGMSGVRLGADASGLGTGFDYYAGAAHGSISTWPESILDIGAGTSGMQPVPDDLPLEPIFVYDVRDRLEIWWYAGDWLKCYNWKMRLKYAYRIGVPEDCISLGRTGAGRLLVAISTTRGLVVLEHASTDDPTWLVMEDDTGSAEDIINKMTNQVFCAWWIDRVNASNKLFIRPRYQGNVRGKVPVITHSFETSVPEQSTPPNRSLTRKYWSQYSDQIIVKDSEGRIMATVGYEHSMYSFTYELGDVYHEALGQRIGQKLLQIRGQRREKLSVPFMAWRGGAYDYVNLWGRDYCVLTQKTDISSTLKTDIECISLSPESVNFGLIRCVLLPLYNIQGGAYWGYDWEFSAVAECAGIDCPACRLKREALVAAIIALLNTEWVPPAGAAPGRVAEDSDIVSEIELIILSHWTDTIAGTEDTLSSLFEDFSNCVITSCGYGE